MESSLGFSAFRGPSFLVLSTFSNLFGHDTKLHKIQIMLSATTAITFNVAAHVTATHIGYELNITNSRADQHAALSHLKNYCQTI